MIASGFSESRSILNLSRITSGIRKELFIRLNMAPNGTAEIVSLREDLQMFLLKYPELKELDYDLIDIFKSNRLKLFRSQIFPICCFPVI